MNAWKRKAQALARLAEDQKGKPEGELARQKLRSILEKYPEAREYAPIKAFLGRDLVRLKRLGGSTDGSWTGQNIEEALALMFADYRQRLARAEDTYHAWANRLPSGSMVL